MKKEKIYLLGGLMVGSGLLSTFFFISRLQDLFQDHLDRYSQLFHKGLMGECLYLDILMYLYIASILFKNLYYVLGGSLLLCFLEFGREVGLLASLIGFVTEASFRLVTWAINQSFTVPFSLVPLLLFLMGISIHYAFFYFLTRKTLVESLKHKV